jgi:hypothetical protein
MMSKSVVQLKRGSGSFAAGVEVQRAATLLSDAAFKLFIWVCLHTDRRSGVLSLAVGDPARALHKTSDEINSCLEEMVRIGVCRFRAPGHIEIRDLFWPYARTGARANGDDTDAYVAAVREIFLRQGCVQSSFTPADHRLATEWNRQGITLECVERAILLGVIRKYVALVNHPGGTLITALHYFTHLIEEVGQLQMSPDYWRYVAFCGADFEHRWRNLSPASHGPQAKSKETK